MATRPGRNRCRCSLNVCVLALVACIACLAPAHRTLASETGAIVVTATRVPALIDDEPLHVEAVPAEEIEENLTVQPGNLSSLLTELPGARVQSVAPALSGAKLQLRGLPGRHTVVLTDGLPLLGAQPDAFGLLQTPPLDLRQVEVIKGAASALYGSSALAGVLNLVSNSPAAESSLLANLSSRGGKDVLAFASLGNATLTAGAFDQARQDVDDDGWADVGSYRRYTLRPRLWWTVDEAHSVLVTAGWMDEEREGGSASFPEALDTRRVDGGAVARWGSLAARLSATSTRVEQVYGAEQVDYTRRAALGEVTLSGNAGRHNWLLGAALEHDELDATALPGIGYTYDVPALLAQDEFSAASWVTLAASARIDAHGDYGTFFSPRLSALWRRPGGEWSLRASLGGGFAAPTPFVDEVEATSLARVLPPRGLSAERGRSASIDGRFSNGAWDVNGSVFAAQIDDPLQARPAGAGEFELVNEPGSRRAAGMEALVGYVSGALHLIASGSYLDSDLARVPRLSAELAGILEDESRGRVGLELGYTGKQALEDNPYRSESRPYFELNALTEIRFGKLAVFFNAINLTDVRQTHFDPLPRPTPGPGGNPITDAWAPLAGRTFNLGVRVEL